MKNENLKKYIKEYVQIEKQLKGVKELEKRQKELKTLITQEMEDKDIKQYNFCGRVITYIKGYIRKAYEVPEAVINPSVKIQGGAR